LVWLLSSRLEEPGRPARPGRSLPVLFWYRREAGLVWLLSSRLKEPGRPAGQQVQSGKSTFSYPLLKIITTISLTISARQIKENVFKKHWTTFFLLVSDFSNFEFLADACHVSKSGQEKKNEKPDTLKTKPHYKIPNSTGLQFFFPYSKISF
jgi:hypothetical protein